MAIYCMQCGKELPDDANFCLKCGKPVGNAAKLTPQPEPQWEYCEIVYAELQAGGILQREKIQFWAKAIGPRGEYTAAEAPEVYADQAGWGRISSSGRTQSAYLPALNALLTQLSREGWESLPNKGVSWYSYKFRRKLN